MSVEKQVRRALWRVVFWRMVGDVFQLPQTLLSWVGNFFMRLSDFIRLFEQAIFYMEIDAARRYKLLTGIDLATASGIPLRYAGLDPERMERIQAEAFGELYGDDEDE